MSREDHSDPDVTSEIGPVDDTSAITTTALLATVALPVVTEISASRITAARRQGGGGGGGPFSPTAASQTSAEAAEAASEALRQHRLHSMSSGFPDNSNYRSPFDPEQGDGEDIDDNQSDENDQDRDQDHDHVHDDNHDDHNNDDNGTSDSGDEAVEFSEWEKTYATVHGNYRARLGLLQLRLCDDIHQRLVQHQNEMQALEQQVVQELKALAPGFSRTMRSLMEHNFEHHQKKQKKCCEEIGETLFASLGGAMIATGASKGDEVLQKTRDDNARWMLFQWSGKEWPIAKIECDTDEGMPRSAGRGKGKEDEEEEDDEEKNQDSHSLPIIAYARVQPSGSMRTSTTSDSTSVFSDSTSKSASLHRDADRQMPSAPPPTRQPSIVSEPPSLPFTPHAREPPSGGAAAVDHTGVTNQFHGGVHYHYATACCHCCSNSRQEHQRSKDYKTDDDDDDSHSQHQPRHLPGLKSQQFHHAASSSSGSSESRTCATSGTDGSASSKGANSEAQDAAESQSCCGVCPPEDIVESTLPTPAIPSWAKRPKRDLTKTLEISKEISSQTDEVVGKTIVHSTVNSHPLDRTSSHLFLNKPRSPCTKVDDGSKVPLKEPSATCGSCCHQHPSQTSPSQVEAISSSSSSEEYHFSEFTFAPRCPASIPVRSMRSLASKARKPPKAAVGLDHDGRYDSGTRPGTPLSTLPSSSEVLRRMSRRRRHPEIQNRLALRAAHNMDVWQLRLARIRHEDSNADDQEEYDSDESSWVRIAHIGEAMMMLEGQREAALKLRIHRMAFRKNQCQSISSRTWEGCCECLEGDNAVLRGRPCENGESKGHTFGSHQ
ncbi:unnamed protein product [Mortierella alpina]